MKLSLFALLFAAAPLPAQFETAEVLGTVRDNSGAVVSRANIVLVNQGTGIQAKTVTGGLTAQTLSGLTPRSTTAWASCPSPSPIR